MSKKIKKVTKKIELPKSSYQLLEAAAALHGLEVEQYMVDAVVSTVLSDLEMLENCLENLGELEKMSRDVVEAETEVEVVPAPETKKVSKKKKAEKKETPAPEAKEEPKPKKTAKKAQAPKAKPEEKEPKAPVAKAEKPAKATKKAAPAKKATVE